MNRKEYEERIAKLEKELDELKEVEIVDDEFPKHGQAYWFVDTDGDIVVDYWHGNIADNYRKTFFRIFKNKKECERYLEIQKAFKEESGKFEPNWKDCDNHKYYLFYDHNNNSIKISWGVTTQFDTLYFKSEKALKELISRFGEEDIKKYYFGIEVIEDGN
nr:MAG TPA: hypothetical protein [Caudoviricetes sp.]